MICPICGHYWCWTCGLSSESLWHKIQDNDEETGYLCSYIQAAYDNKYLKKFP